MPSDELSSNDSAVIDDDLVQALGFEPSVEDDVVVVDDVTVDDADDTVIEPIEDLAQDAPNTNGVTDDVEVTELELDDQSGDGADEIAVDEVVADLDTDDAAIDDDISDLAAELGFQPVDSDEVVDLDEIDIDELTDADVASADLTPDLDVDSGLDAGADLDLNSGSIDLDGGDTAKAAKGFGLGSFFSDRRNKKKGDEDDLDLDSLPVDEAAAVDELAAELDATELETDAELDDVASAFVDSPELDADLEADVDADVDVELDAEAADLDVLDGDEIENLDVDADTELADVELADLEVEQLETDIELDGDLEPDVDLDADVEAETNLDTDAEADLDTELDTDADADLEVDASLSDTDSDSDTDSGIDGADLFDHELDDDFASADLASADLASADLEADVDTDDLEANGLIDLTSDVDAEAPTALVDPIDVPDLDTDFDPDLDADFDDDFDLDDAVPPVGVPAAKVDSGAVVASPSEVRKRRPRRRKQVRARKARRVVRHIDPWSVLTFSVLFHLAFFAAMLLASVLVWNAALASGTLENIENFITELGDYETFEINGDVVFRSAVIIAGMLTLASSVMVVLLTVVFNLISDLIGGIRITVIEEETVRVPAKTSRR